MINHKCTMAYDYVEVIWMEKNVKNPGERIGHVRAIALNEDTIHSGILRKADIKFQGFLFQKAVLSSMLI